MAKKRKLPGFGEWIHATDFWIAAHQIDQNLAFPVMNIEALALELHLKCFLIIRLIPRRKFKREHVPSVLIQLLSKRDQRRLEATYSQTVAFSSDCQDYQKEGILMDYDSVLRRSKNIFVRARYNYEGYKWAEDRKGGAGNPGVREMTDAIRDIITHNRPTWWRHGSSNKPQSFT